jgi:hypothetical protein
MLFVGHGSRGKRFEPEASEVLRWGENKENPTFEKLKEQIKKIATPTHPVRIVCLTCYGGGIHYISQDLDLTNVCSVATAPYFMSSVSSFPQSKFNEGFLDRLSSQDSHTFAEAAIAGFRKDRGNLNLGQLSSFDYLDKIFKRGPYHPELIKNFSEYKGLSRTKESYHLDYAAIDMYDRLDLPMKYRSPPPRTLGAEGLSCGKTIVSPSDQLLTLARSIESSMDLIQRYPSGGNSQEKIKSKEEFVIPYLAT